MKVKKSAVWGLVEKAFPQYKGRKFFVDLSGRVGFSNTNWGGGSRNIYIGMNLGNLAKQEFFAPAPWKNPVEGCHAEIPPGFCVIENSVFCGALAGITVYINPQDFAFLLEKKS